MSIHTILSQMEWRNDCTNEKKKHHPLCIGCEKIVVLNKEEVDALATRIVEESKKEERERIKKELKGLDCGFCNYEEEVMERIDSGTKL